MKKNLVSIFGDLVIILSLIVLIITFLMINFLGKLACLLLVNNTFWLLFGIILVYVDKRLQKLEYKENCTEIEIFDEKNKKVVKSIKDLSINELNEEIEKSEAKLNQKNK